MNSYSPFTFQSSVYYSSSWTFRKEKERQWELHRFQVCRPPSTNCLNYLTYHRYQLRATLPPGSYALTSFDDDSLYYATFPDAKHAAIEQWLKESMAPALYPDDTTQYPMDAEVSYEPMDQYAHTSTTSTTSAPEEYTVATTYVYDAREFSQSYDFNSPPPKMHLHDDYSVNPKLHGFAREDHDQEMELQSDSIHRFFDESCQPVSLFVITP